MYPVFGDVFLSDYRSELFHRGMITPKRVCEDFELEFYKTGDGVSFVDGKSYPQRVGNIILAKPGQRRYSEGSFSCYAVHFSCNDREMAEVLFADIPDCVYLPEAEPLFAELIALPTIPQKPFLLRVHSLIFEIMARIHQVYPSSTAVEETSFASVMEINRICNYIKESFADEEFSIEVILKNSLMSRSGFFKAFKSVTGMTPSEYINAVRTEHAKKLLCNTGNSLSFIANECGFGSQSYFCRIFKARQGITPFEYRKAHFEQVEGLY